jgi:hypothetical protein
MGVYSQKLAELKKTRVKLEKALNSAARKNAELNTQEGALKSAIRERGAWMATALKTASPSLPVPVACTVLEAETEISKLLGELELSPPSPLANSQPAPSPIPSGSADSSPVLTHFQHIRARISPDVLEAVRCWSWQDYNNRATDFVR